MYIAIYTTSIHMCIMIWISITVDPSFFVVKIFSFFLKNKNLLHEMFLHWIIRYMKLSLSCVASWQSSYLWVSCDFWSWLIVYLVWMASCYPYFHQLLVERWTRKYVRLPAESSSSTKQSPSNIPAARSLLK